MKSAPTVLAPTCWLETEREDQREHHQPRDEGHGEVGEGDGDEASSGRFSSRSR
jgi:hypothetical protein